MHFVLYRCNIRVVHVIVRQLNADNGCQIVSDHLPTILNMFWVALFILMKTPLLICLNLISWRHFLTLGETWLIPRILMTKASLGSAPT